MIYTWLASPVALCIDIPRIGIAREQWRSQGGEGRQSRQFPPPPGGPDSEKHIVGSAVHTVELDVLGSARTCLGSFSAPTDPLAAIEGTYF